LRYGLSALSVPRAHRASAVTRRLRDSTMTTGMNSVVIAVVVTIVVIGTFVLSIWMSKTNQIQENNNPKNPRKQQSEEWERNRLSDENVLKAKADFEMRIDQNADLTYGIGW